MIDDGKVEIFCVLHRPAHDAGVRHGAHIVRDSGQLRRLFISPISASSLPSEDFVMAPIGKTFAKPARSALLDHVSVIAALSLTDLFRHRATDVQPPRRLRRIRSR